MADSTTTCQTMLSCDEVILRAVQFFSTEKFRTSSQSGRAATFDGRPPIPWIMIILTILGLLFCIIPGLIMYFMFVRKMYRFQNLVVTANPLPSGSEVSISSPSWATKTVSRFVKSLPTSANVPPRIA